MSERVYEYKSVCMYVCMYVCMGVFVLPKLGDDETVCFGYVLDVRKECVDGLSGAS
jgi:hypothetical protein